MMLKKILISNCEAIMMSETYVGPHILMMSKMRGSLKPKAFLTVARPQYRMCMTLIFFRNNF